VPQTTSFLSRVQSWFSGRNQGRYLAFVLCEVSGREPKAIQDMLCKAWGLGRRQLPAPHLEPEYVFGGRKGSRRADIAVYASADAPDPIGLIEIKYMDALQERTDVKPGQLEDYLRWEAAARGRNVLILSREHLSVVGAPALTWTEVARQLRAHAGSEIVRMLIEHLEEEGIVLQTVDSKAVVGFLRRLLCPWNGSGRQAGNLDGPTEFGKLLKNLSLLSERFNGDFKRAWAAAGGKHAPDEARGTKNASIDFDVYPRVKASKKPGDIFDDEEDRSIAVKARAGGLVDLFARHALGSSKNWLRVGYGFQIEVSAGTGDGNAATKLPTTYVYAWANGEHIQKRKLDVFSRQKLKSMKLISEDAEASIDQVERLARKQLGKVFDELMATPKLLTAQQRAAIVDLRRTC
jgi:hypothetical protein